MDVGVWPARGQSLMGWERTPTCFRREIRKAKDAPLPLEEMILRFPSAPLHGLQRWHGNHVALRESESFHTYRVLRARPEGKAHPPTKRIFLMHTGLNERDRMRLYYLLASHLAQSEEGTVCIVRPFPGHLTRFPFPAFAETPLDRYLWDGSHLFRQFLRFMVETQWFLSALVRRSSYRCPSGANLLGEDEELEKSRLVSRHLAEEMRLAWMKLHRASKDALRELQRRRPGVTRVKEPVPRLRSFENTIASLRAVLQLDRFEGQPGTLVEGSGQDEPELHVFGYSLGGFTAQSVLMSWPFVIASCSNLLAGGALRELAPTTFADPEEWQTVLHSLRYELDDRLMSPEVTGRPDSVAGMDPDLFTYFKRTFYEVFQQEYSGSFETRADTFRERMFFIVGGDDPVVRPQRVVGSVEKGGLNLLEIGGLSHFVGSRSASRGRKKDSPFWIEEMAALIHQVARKAAESLRDERPYVWFDREMRYPARDKAAFDRWLSGDQEDGKPDEPRGVERLKPTELAGIGTDGALSGELFERCLDDLLARLEDPEEPGILFILRNEIPAVLLPEEAVRESAAALYHDDFGIVRYCHGIKARLEVVDRRIGRICLILPWNARSLTMHIDERRAYPSQAESAGGQVVPRMSDLDVWNSSRTACERLAAMPGGQESIRVFDGRTGVGDEPPALFRKAEKDFARGQPLEHVAALPDCWVWVSTAFLGKKLGAAPVIERAIRTLRDELLKSDDERIHNAIANDTVRVVTVSRARYNPRFRGRLVLDARRARQALFHVTMCALLSDRLADAEPFE